ncbi:dentin sialophosphoprotein-like [Saccostrea cucullata]|uniref:dentin sialophosphoprotein-like n=1 Tax=Saccostrea cuccullata TaxID=36930 RepID=UPI002ED0618B
MASSSKSVKFSDKNIPEKSLKSNTEGITLTGQYTSYNQEISGQKDNQLPPSVTISVQSESSEVSSIIRRTQKEIERENESKGRLIENRKDESKGTSAGSTGPTSREIEAFHQTSPKSSFLDDNLNDPEDLYKKNQSVSTKDVMGQSSKMETTHGLDAGVPNINAESILSRSEESSRQTNIAGNSQSSNVQNRGPIVHDEQSDSNEGGSSLTKAVKDLRKVLESETHENTSDTQRPQGNSMNIPVPSSGPIAQCDSCQEGSNKDLKELRETLEEVSPRGISDLRPPGNSINIPVQTDGSTEEGNPIAAPDSTVSCGSDLFQSGPVESGSGDQGEGQTGGHPTTVPVPATDQSGAKNMEMDARELRHDIANQPSTQSYRDIQNSMPDHDLDGGNGQSVNSLINRIHYDTEETSPNQTQDQSTPGDTQINISGTLQMSDSVSISGVCSNIAGPNGNLVSSTADDDNAV